MSVGKLEAFGFDRLVPVFTVFVFEVFAVAKPLKEGTKIGAAGEGVRVAVEQVEAVFLTNSKRDVQYRAVDGVIDEQRDVGMLPAVVDSFPYLLGVVTELQVV